MTIEKIIKMEVTKKELSLIRSALCEKAMKTLCHAHSIQQECAGKEMEDTTSCIWLQERDAIHKIIDSIDGKQ
jgi:hypothetical protein